VKNNSGVNRLRKNIRSNIISTFLKFIIIMSIKNIPSKIEHISDNI